MHVLNTILIGLAYVIQRIGQWLFKKIEVVLMVFLLNMMSLAFKLSPEYRQNIENFKAVYVFKIKQGDIVVTVTFKEGRMKVEKGEATNFTVKLVVKDTKSLWNYIAGGGSVFDFILDDGLSWGGNLNYILKFAYLVTHLLYTVLEKLKLNQLIPMER